MTKHIDVISWDDAKKLLPQSKADSAFCNLVSKLSSSLEKRKEHYLYRIKLGFGDRFIDKGTRYLFEDNGFIVNNTIPDITKTIKDFKEDLNYTVDPLGMVIKNHIEVYSENEISNKSGSPLKKYRVHLNTIKAGELFGLYGTLDYFNGYSGNENQDWYAQAGNSCFEILFPFQNDTVLTDIIKSTNPNNALLNKNIATSIDDKITFFKQYIEVSDKNWRTDIIYFPKHFLSTNNSDFKIFLFETGWTQSKAARNFLFENKVLSDSIDITYTRYALKNNKHLLNFLIDTIIKASKGETYLLKPLRDNDHILNIALTRFKQDISTHLSKNTNCIPVILNYDKITNLDWGCLAIDSIPILLNYPQINLNQLEDDLKAIKDNSALILPDFYTTADSGSGPDRYKGRAILEADIKNTLCLGSGKISLTTKGLSNFIVIKNKIE